MKKAIAILLALLMVLSLAACGGGSKKKAFSLAKKAFDEIEEAYSITESFGDDVYEAWRIAIYEDDELLEDGIKHLATQLHLSESELSDGVAAYLIEDVGEGSWETASLEEKNLYKDNTAALFGIFESSLFSFVVGCVVKAYSISGKSDMIQAALVAAKADMKEMSEKYSDYEHYASLKKYYTTTNAYYEFCKNPTGSFEQLKTTTSNYSNDARTHRNDLAYIFED